MEWDVFICHASEDKEEFVRPLAEALRDAGLKVWYDEFSLGWGDRLGRTIDRGLAESRYGIVVLSSAFFEKHWPKDELDGLAQREVDGENVIRPIWHKVGRDEVACYSLRLADRKALLSSDGPEAIAIETLRIVKGEEAAAQYDKVGPIRGVLRSKADAYPRTQELLTPVEMAQLYLVRKQVGNLSEAESRLLLHSNLAGNGPAWYWHRKIAREQYLRQCREVLRDWRSAALSGAAEALARLGGRKEIPIFLEMMRAPYQGPVVAAARAIARVVISQDMPLLREMQENLEADVRVAALGAIARVGGRDDVPTLWRMMKHKYALLGMGARFLRRVPATARVLTEGTPRVRAAAVKAIGCLGTPGDIPKLRRILRDANEQVRRAAAEAVGRLATSEELPLLQEMLKSDDQRFRLHAAHAMRRVAYSDKIAALDDELTEAACGEVREELAQFRSRTESELDGYAELILKFRPPVGSAGVYCLLALDRGLYCPFEQLKKIDEEE